MGANDWLFEANPVFSLSPVELPSDELSERHAGSIDKACTDTGICCRRAGGCDNESRIDDILMKIQGSFEHHSVASAAGTPGTTRAELMSDSAIYQRTPSGQRELLRASNPSATAALRLLARFNGYTDLRRLVDLSPTDARETPKAIAGLFEEGLIELVDNSM